MRGGLYSLDKHNGVWKGDRLAVQTDHRASGAGGPWCGLPSRVHAHGGRRVIAHIEVANVAFFERLGWSAYSRYREYLGITQRPMEVALTRG